jgi:hypothetical protein
MIFLLAGKQADYNGKTSSLNQAKKCHDFPTEKTSICRKLNIKEI